MKCPKCYFNGNPNLEEVKMHTKATCPDCGAYIKMVGKDELDAIIDTSIKEADKVEEHELTLTIHTIAPEEYFPIILTRVKKSLEKGFTDGEGSVMKPFDESPYHYDFYLR